MWLAAYMVVGFLVASVYAVGMLRGRARPLPPARLHRSRSRWRRSRRPIQLFVGDTAAREVADDQPAKFAAHGVHLQGRDRSGRVRSAGSAPTARSRYGDRDPRARLVLVDFDTDTDGHRARPDPADRPPAGSTMLHLSFDTMVGIGTALLVLAAWFAFVWWRRRDLRPRRWFLRAAAVAGVAAVVALEVRLDRHRGRAPAVDRQRLHAHLGGGDPGPGDLVRLRVHASRSTSPSGVAAVARARAAGAALARGAAQDEGEVPYGLRRRGSGAGA